MANRAAEVRVRIKGTSVYLATAASSDAVRTVDYPAASTVRRARGWLTSGAGPNGALLGSLPTLRDRSRAAVRENATAAAAIEAIVSNTIGVGIKPQSQAPDQAFRKAAHRLWGDWTDEADADGRGDFYALQALAMRSIATAGEVFVRMRTRRPSDGLTVPLQIQLLEAELCPVEKNELAPNGNQIRGGIEFDRIGRRVAYWMYSQHPTDGTITLDANALLPKRIRAEEILHLFLPIRPGQIRGEPWLTRALVKLREIDRYDDAEVVRKKTAAMFAGFVTSEATETPFPTQADQDGDSEEVVISDIEPGTWQTLRPGEEITFSNPADVGQSYDAFMRWQFRLIATGAGITYEQLTGDYEKINDRTLRATLHEFRRRCMMWQHNLIAFGMNRPIWRRWIDYALYAGALTAPADSDPAALKRVKWVPQAWPYLHPVQDVEAQEREVRAGFASRSEKVSERGYDAEAIDAEQASDNVRADGLGLSYDSDGRRPKTGPATVASPEPEEDPEQEGRTSQ